MTLALTRSHSRILATAVCGLIGLSLPACAQQNDPETSQTATLPASLNSRNAVWLGHAYVTTPAVVATVPQLCVFMRDHKVKYWFVNLGTHDKDGHFSKGVASVPQIVQFLDAVNDWEKANGTRFTVLGWLNGSSDEASARYIDLSKDDVRHTMIEECRRFADPKAEGSYVAGAARIFDGIQYDLEPSGADEKRFSGLISLMTELKKAIGPDKLTSFTAHKLGETGRYNWSADFFYRMASQLDLMCVMTYDEGSKDEPTYRGWMKKQTTGVLRAVSGAQWNNDADHPVLPKASKVLFGFPAFPPNKYHVVGAETVAAAAQGAKDGLNDLVAAKDPSLKNMEGAAVYLYTDGTGKDNYSNPSDWTAFNRDWLGLK